MTASLQLDQILDTDIKPSSRQMILILCFLVMLFDGYDLNFLGYIGPALVSHLGATKPQFGTAISAGLAGFMAGAFIFGGLGDRVGRRPMTILGVALFGLLTAACAFVSSIDQLAALRFVAGIGLGGAIPNAIALNAEFAHHKTRAGVIGVMFVGYTLGGALPGWVAGGLVGSLGWQVVPLIGGVGAVVLACVLFLKMSESLRFLASRLDRRSELLAGLHALTGRHFNSNVEIVTSEKPAKGLPVYLLFTEGRAITTVLLWIAFIAGLTANLFVISWTPTMLASAGIAASHAALIGAMYQTGAAVGSVIVTRLIDKKGAVAVLCWMAAAIPCVAAVGQAGFAELALIVAVFIAGFFASAGQVGLNAVAGVFYPTFIRSTGVGWANGVGRVGSIAGPMIGGILISSGYSVSVLFGFAAIPLMLVVTALALLLMTTRRSAVQTGACSRKI